MNNDTNMNRSAAGSDDIISLSEIVAIIMNGKWWIAGSTLLFTVVALAYLWLATPIYRADALVQVESQKSPLGALVDVQDALGGGESASETEIEVIRSRFVLGDVVKNQKLQIVAEPKYLPVIGQAVARRFKALPDQPVNSSVLGISSFAWGGERITVERFQLPSHLFGENFTLTVQDGRNYQLELEGVPVLTGRVGEAAGSHDGQIRLFISELQARPNTRFNLTKLPLISAIENLSQRLSISEKGRKTGVLSLAITGADSEENRRLLNAVANRYLRQNVERVSAEAQNSLEFLENQLPGVKDELEVSENRLNQFRLENKTIDLTLETKAVLAQVVEIDSQLVQLNIQLEQMMMRYTENHPLIKELLSQRDYLQNRKDEFVTQTEDLPQTQQDVLRMQRDVEVNTLVYTELLNKAQELKIVKASAVGNVRILDKAMSAIKPIKPKKALVAVLATLLGAMLGTGLVFVREMMRQGVKTPEEIESKTGLPVYATVPESEQLNVLHRNAQKQGGRYLLAESAPADLAVESLRSLRTNLVFALMEADNNRIMITGPSPAVGKSFVSANLATLLAESGKKTLVIDADMRKGHINKVYDLPKENGLADCIVGKISLSQACHKINEHLDVMTTGQFPPNPSELLMTPAFREMLNQASQEYDVVIIDTPPILAVTDAAIVGKQCGSNFMIVRAEVNPIREVAYAADRLKQADIQINGCVLNGMKATSSRYGQYGYYQYSYS